MKEAFVATVKKNSSVVTIDENSSPTLVISIYYGTFLIAALLCFVNPFFKNLLIFSSVVTTIISVIGCMSTYEDREKGVKRPRPKQKRFFPKWTFHAFFVVMIVITAGLELGYYFVSVCWVINWIMLYSSIQHIKATFEDEKEALEEN